MDQTLTSVFSTLGPDSVSKRKVSVWEVEVRLTDREVTVIRSVKRRIQKDREDEIQTCRKVERGKVR